MIFDDTNFQLNLDLDYEIPLPDILEEDNLRFSVASSDNLRGTITSQDL